MNAPSEEKYAELDRLAEEFAERWRGGERPPLQEFIDRRPDLADDIRELFPALVEMAQAEPDAAAPARAPAAPPLQRVGEYRILREVGRGGMGVVYEADQTSLGRRVALKVLPAQLAKDPKALGRFQREARAAARLHHTNIVPVFEVGQDGGLCFYAMQFIQGQALDQVIDELRRLRAHSAGRGRKPAEKTADAPPPEVSRITQALLAGPPTDAAAAPQCLSPTPTTADHPTAPDAPAPRDRAPSSAGLRGPTSGDGSELRPFFQSVARTGQQVAQALAYAHQRGVVHRDVKPSNLLLDAAGVVWVTDFGLAKTDDGGLTATGDVLGTFRYMSPERFHGQCDARADIYSLGLTLYELATLRPAFDCPDRMTLVARIASDEPPRPRSLDPRIPRDLETIILKAIAKEPRRRYQTAAEMAEDLRRFLADEPIRARRTGGLERLRLWRRRNPALAALTACLLLVLVTVAVGSTAAALYLTATLAESEKNRKQLAQAELQGKYKLWEADLNQAQARRMSRKPGQRFAALRSIQEALKLPTPPGRSINELRTEAIAAFCVPDIEQEMEWDGWPVGSGAVGFDPTFERYARADFAGNVTVRRVSDDTQLFAFLAPPGVRQAAETGAIAFSPDGRFLHQLCRAGCCYHSRLWRLDGPAPAVVLDDDHSAVAFSPDGERFAADYPDGTIRVYSAASGEEMRRYPTGLPQTDWGLTWDPVGVRLLFVVPEGLRWLDLETGRVDSMKRPMPAALGYAAWSPNGRELALTAADYNIRLWDAASKRTRLELAAPGKRGIQVRFSPSGDRLLSTDWGALWMLWDARSGRRLLTMPASWNAIQFSRDGRRLAAGTVGQKLCLFRCAEGTEFRGFRGLSDAGPGVWANATPIDASGRLLAVRTAAGIALIDMACEEQVGFIPPTSGRVVGFEPDGSLLTEVAGGPVRWPVAVDGGGGRRTFGPPQKLWSVPGTAETTSASADGRVIVTAANAQCPRGATLIHPSRGESRLLGPQQDARNCAVSPDGRWVATASFELDQGYGVKIWDGDTGQFVRDLPIPGGGETRFSPDGRWLLTTGQGPRIWKVDGWEEGPDLHGDPLNPLGAFSADGKLLALGDAPGVVRLLETETGRELARLTTPEDTRLTPTAFTADGARLIVYSGDSSALFLFDLRALRAELAELGLDWDAPPYAPAADSAKPPLLTVVVDATGLGGLMGK